MPYPLTLLLVVFLCTRAPAQGNDGMQLESDENGVEVYVRAEENGDMTVRVKTEARTQVQSVQEVLDAADGYPEWVHRCDGAYAVEGGSADDYLFVSGIDMPFPFRDKEVVARVRQHTDESGRLVRTILAEPGAIPANKGRDRLEVYQGEWVITPLSGGTVELQCTVRTDAGSGLPNWVRKEIMTGGPAKTMVNLRQRLLQSR